MNFRKPTGDCRYRCTAGEMDGQDCEWFSKITCGILCGHRREGYCHYQPEITITEETLADLLHTYETRVTNDKAVRFFEKPAATRRFANSYFQTREDVK